MTAGADEPDLAALYPELNRLEAPPDNEDTAYLRESVWTLIAPGFVTLDDALDATFEQVQDEGFELSGQQISRIVTEAWLRRLYQLEEPTPRDPTDDARVAAAFDSLRADGLIAVMNCEYTQDEASAVCSEQARAQRADGYAFFHGQDTERLAEPDATLYIGFDAVSPDGRFADRAAYDSAAVAVGRRIVNALARQDLRVDWDGTATNRVSLTGLDWRRPLPQD